ncbi:methionine ABC transporter ATP-binding protein [Novosphingobium olei]|uniref:Cell division ATP-binding protein FtsE n=1 Tax=Novosphingobium olei TaxID=2728851 RepID=A0A7Y0G7V0_9SPHN|nr:ATP-binding cassette domain-containing protein [Novosphingobium olei]NML92225.1 ATP-binding cassette domain-containing protein [Novosphingobium olei]
MIRLEGVHKRFPGAGGAALDGVNLAIARGEVFGIIGRSGAGKSTLVRMINGLERPSAGRVTLDGVDVAALAPADLRALRRRVGMIFQGFGLLSSATAAQNIALPLRIAGTPAREVAARVAELLGMVGLTDHADKYPAQLSGGQKQRVGIARALATRPDVLLCDEATSALDPETTRDVLALIAALNRDLGLTIVLITHEMDVVRQVCGRVAVLHAGKVVESGATVDVVLDPRHAETRSLLAEEGGAPSYRHSFAGEIVRFTARGEAAAGPLISRIARETGTEIAILEGRVGHLGDTPYAQLTLGLSAGNIAAARAALAQAGVIGA